MTNSFGFSNSNQIRTFLDANLAAFVGMVKSHSVLLNSYRTPAQFQEVKEVALRQVYPRIGLILSTAKRPDNTYLFGESERVRFAKVVEVIVNPSMPYHEGITSVAAALTAVVLGRSIPLSSDLKFAEAADRIEDRAYKDLGSILEFYKRDDGSSSADEGDEENKEYTIYLSLNVDKQSLPEEDFEGDLVDLDQTRPNQAVTQLRSLVVPPSKVAFLYLYLSARRVGDLPGNDGSVEVAVPLVGSPTVYDVASLICDTINSLSLNDAGVGTNILASTNPYPGRTYLLDIDRRKLYPDSTVPNSIARATVWFEKVSLRFEARRTDAFNSRELVVVSFHTISKTALYGGTTYRGTWTAGNYVVGDVVDYQGVTYLCRTNTNVAPPSSGWVAKTPTPDLLLSRRHLAERRIEGLLHSTTPNLGDMVEVGSRSLTFSVSRDGYKAIQPTLDDVVLNTFYFQVEGTLSGTLGLRLSSTPANEVTGPLVDENGAFLLDVEGLDATGLCEAIITTLYQVGTTTEVLGALTVDRVGNVGVTLTAFRDSEFEVREVVDLLRVDGEWVTGLSVAVGDYRTTRTAFTSGPRSLILPIRKKDNLKENKAALLKSNPESNKASKIQMARPSERLQSTFDRIRRIHGYSSSTDRQ